MVKQVQEIIFNRKTKTFPHLSLVFNNANVTQSIYQNYLGIVLESKLTFENHLKMLTAKLNKIIGILVKLQNLLSKTLITIYKAFVRRDLDYDDFLHGQLFIYHFSKN